MTEPLPTDEELKEWETKSFPGGRDWRLLACVRHLRGEVTLREERIRTEQREADRSAEACRLAIARRAALEAEVSDLREHLEEARALARRQTEEAERYEAETHRAKADALEFARQSRDLRKQLEAARMSEAAAPARIRAALQAADTTNGRHRDGGSADEEARLSDPKRHPFRPSIIDLKSFSACADCGAMVEEHQA